MSHPYVRITIIRVTSYQNINKKDYYTISTSGCTHFLGDEVELITLEKFEREYQHFVGMRKVSVVFRCRNGLLEIYLVLKIFFFKLPLFAQFRLWKVFLRWRKVIRYAQMGHCQRYLENNLFIANPTLRPALLNLREMCYAISGMTLCRIEKGKTSTLLDFLSCQMVQLSEVHLRLVEFHELIKEIIRSACRTALLEHGFMPDDYFLDEADLPSNLGKSLRFSGDIILIQNGLRRPCVFW